MSVSARSNGRTARWRIFGSTGFALLALLVLTVGCTADPAESANNSNVTGDWSLTNINDQPVLISAQLKALTLQADGTSMVWSGCSWTIGKYRVDGETLSFSDQLTPLSDCRADDRQAQETLTRVRAVLPRMTDGPLHVDVRKNELRLTLSDGTFVTYTRLSE